MLTDKEGRQPGESTIAEAARVAAPIDQAMSSPEGAEAEAQHLLKRTPASYLLNQAYGLWFFISWFLLTVIITRKLTTDQYGIFAITQAAFNTITYLVALGLEDATTTFVPRVLAEHGPGSAALLIRRLLGLRVVIMVASAGMMLFGMAGLAALIGLIPGGGPAGIAAALRDPHLLGHITPIAFNVIGNGIVSLLTAVCASFMRMRLVFIIGGVTQLLTLGLGFLVLQLGWGVDGMLWLLAAGSLFGSVAFLVWLAPLLIQRGATYIQPLKPVLKLGVASWLTNLVSGSLLKQTAIILLGYFAISITAIGYFNLASQLGHTASLLLVTGFGGVAGSALAAAFIGLNRERLSRSWQALIKIETILAAPVLVFCLFNAQNFALTFYGSKYAAVGSLLAIFLFFNIVVRVLGSTIHQSTLYVVGKARLVVLGQWLGLLALIVLGIVLIPRWGPAGALMADGLAQVLTGGLLLSFLWKDLPHKYPLGFTLRILLALTIAALPSIVWHPTNRVLLVVSGIIFLILSMGLLLLIKPLTALDVEMIASVNPGIARYLAAFARKA